MLKSEPCNNAGFFGHFKILQWLRALDPPYDWNVSTLLCGLASGNVVMVVRMFVHGVSSSPLEGKDKLFAIACQYGHILMLEFLRDRSFPLSSLCSAAAAANGQLDVLKWLENNGYPFDNLTLAAALGTGCYQTMESLFEFDAFHVFHRNLPAVDDVVRPVIEFLLRRPQFFPFDETVSHAALRSNNLDQFL